MRILILTFFRKKMNFTTDLPKKDPIVSYIVASAVKCEKFFPGSSKEGPVYRMHAVILTKRPDMNLPQNDQQCKKSVLSVSTNGGGNGVSRQNGKQTGTSKWAPAQNASKYILCHVRKVTSKKEEGEDEDLNTEFEIKEEQDDEDATRKEERAIH
jgi:hypothetical protein